MACSGRWRRHDAARLSDLGHQQHRPGRLGRRIRALHARRRREQQDGAQGIITHAVAVTGAPSDGLYPNFIKAMAKQGGGSSTRRPTRRLVKALLEVFNDPGGEQRVRLGQPAGQRKSHGTYLNQVYVGMFQPDAMAKPRWYGNLKQYMFAFDP